MTPIRIALLISSVFLVPSLIYIALSSYFAATLVATPEEAAMIEIIKGFGYVTVSAVLIFFVSWKLLSNIDRRQSELQTMREALLYAERRSMAGLLSASMAHDARNELAVLKSNSQFLQRYEAIDETIAEVVDEQVGAIDRLTDLTKMLVNVGRDYGGKSSTTVDIVALSMKVGVSLKSHSRFSECDMRINTEIDSAEIIAFPTLIYQIIINLLFNAADAAGKGGQVELRVKDGKDAVCIEVHDNGPGVPKEDREHVFDAFFTTKEEGTGLGLLSVKACALTHNGAVEVESSPLGGACFRVLLREAASHPYSGFDDEPVMAGRKDRQAETGHAIS